MQMTEQTPMKATLRRVLALCPALLLLALASCQVLRIEDQETLLTYDANADQVDVLMVYRGVSVWSMAKDDVTFKQGDDPRIDLRKVNDADKLARELLDGRRRFRLLPDALEVDLDDEDKELSDADRELLAGVEMVEVKAFLDEDGRLSCFQHVRVRNATRLVARLNEFVNEAIAKDFDAEKVAASEFHESAQLWTQAAQSDWQWLRLDGPVLVLTIPATAQDTARVLLANCRNSESPELFAAVRELRLGDGSVELRLSTLEDPVVYVQHVNQDPRYEDTLKRELMSRLSLDLPRVLPEDLRQAFRARDSDGGSLLKMKSSQD